MIALNSVAPFGPDNKATVCNHSAVCMAEFKVHSGTTETFTVGVIALVPEGAIARIGVNVDERTVNTESGEGVIEVTSVNGNVTNIKKGELFETPCSKTGKIQRCRKKIIKLLEEPIEPERPEGSPFRP